MDDGSIRLHGLFHDDEGNAQTLSDEQLILPNGIEIADIYATKQGFSAFIMRTTENDIITLSGNNTPTTQGHRCTLNWDGNTNYRADATAGASTFNLYINPGWAGQADSFQVHPSVNHYMTIRTADGYVYNPNNIQVAPVTTSIGSYTTIETTTGRVTGVNLQEHTVFTSATATAVANSSRAYATVLAYNGTIEGTMVQAPMLRSFLVT